MQGARKIWDPPFRSSKNRSRGAPPGIGPQKPCASHARTRFLGRGLGTRKSSSRFSDFLVGSIPRLAGTSKASSESVRDVCWFVRIWAHLLWFRRIQNTLQYLKDLSRIYKDFYDLLRICMNLLGFVRICIELQGFLLDLRGLVGICKYLKGCLYLFICFLWIYKAL